MLRIKRNGRTVATERTFRTAKQTWRRLRRADPTAEWTVTDPHGRIALPTNKETPR